MCLDWLILSVFRVFFFPQARWHSHLRLLLTFKACSLLLQCGVNSKWLTMIKQKMKLEWHYLKIYWKPWQVSVCSNISVWNTWRVRNCGFFLVGFLFSLKSKGENTNLSWIPKTAIWISKRGGQCKHMVNNPWPCSPILCSIPILHQL